MSASSPCSVSILDHFSALSDPRQQWRVVYPLREILLLVLCATLSGMDDLGETRLWGEERLDFLRRFLPYERGIPAHDTLNDVINALDAELFKSCFTNWVEARRDCAPENIAVVARPPGAVIIEVRAASRCTWFPHGRPASALSWVRRRPRPNRMRSQLSRISSSDCN